MAQSQKLMQIEAQVRECRTLSDLGIEAVNAGSDLLGVGQVLLFQMSWGRPRIKFASNVSNISNDSPLIQSISSEIEKAVRRSETNTILNFQLDPIAGEPAQFPFGTVTLWEDRKEKVRGGMVFLADRPWVPQSYQLAVYYSELVHHAHRAIVGQKRFNPTRFGARLILWSAVLVGALALWLVELPMSIIAPARVVAKDPTTVTSNLPGVINEIFVQPAQSVTKGMVLAKLDDTELQADLDQAEKNYSVAAAKFENMSRQALSRPSMRRELAVVEAEMQLADVERNWAKTRLERTVIRAPRDGIISIDTPQDLVGRPVEKGATLFDIIDQTQVELRADVPVNDSQLIYELKRADAFLNNAPLTAIPLSIRQIPHSPILDDRGSVSYPITLDFIDSVDARVGSEGYVQLQGPKERLYYVLLRRPLMWLRRNVPQGVWPF
ncbi:HlyD family efflux transporter periplasmic adaptor subunit [Rhodobacteraceae bacterium]|nr:HlyD family efflux transporter periplasmic adaptor subunit [Paracoccaceae bacterium]